MSRRTDQLRLHRRFKVKPYDQPRQEQTPAQKAATRRNFHVFQLRSLETACRHLTGMRRAIALECVDAELRRLGADDTATHRAKGKAAMEARWADQYAATEQARQLRAARIEAVGSYGIDLATAVRIVDEIENPDARNGRTYAPDLADLDEILF